MVENLRVEVSKPRPGLNTQTLEERRTGALVGRKRVGLPALPVQRHHEKFPESLLVGLVEDECLQVCHRIGFPAGGYLGGGAHLERIEPHLL